MIDKGCSDSQDNKRVNDSSEAKQQKLERLKDKEEVKLGQLKNKYGSNDSKVEQSIEENK